MASINELYISVYEKLNKIKLKYDDVDGSLRKSASTKTNWSISKGWQKND